MSTLLTKENVEWFWEQRASNPYAILQTIGDDADLLARYKAFCVSKSEEAAAAKLAAQREN